ncbi:zinc-ribbon domain-containing protein [Actibacterium sp. XHP0104]|uniref:zinc-ribbon domain-containing protein n=1 Tax=Actibacterium sp. XHP0104 TaxID=2984335 RepID=UPI0021E8953E|nr:zinc-ribbon domain-containing protein [Actibacterium sp. XHP0104]MCV2882876.1 zinc-ribbon domain-containing protein [Actibacterium sp. XHP0104]
MRLICPNCDAQYEVDDAMIPAEGRDVQCSACGHTWFQAAAEPVDNIPDMPVEDESDFYLPDDDEYDPVDPEEPEDLAALHDEDDHELIDEPMLTPAPRRKALDDSILDVLREEAEREAVARRTEAQTAAPLESQPDLGLDEPAPAATGGGMAANLRERVARLRGAGTEPAKPARPTARRDLLPDIEEINSTLRATSDRALIEADPDAPVLENDPLPRKRGGFGRGFGAALLIGALAAAVYVAAPKLAHISPGLAPVLSGYVDGVNNLREGVNGTVLGVMRRATGALNNASGG